MVEEIDRSNTETVSSATLRKRYKLLAQLGAGGMALVHLAVARGAAGAEKLVVLKSIRPDLVEDKKVLDMFVDEARLGVQLSHPNVVQTYDVVTFGSLPIIVMEYLEGQSLSKCVANRIPFPIRLHAIREVLSGLDYAHGMKSLDGTPLGIVHRDMSPQNVIVTYDGHVKVLDFGIAKAMGQATHTETGEMKGKLRYMAPEQMIGKSKVDCRADLFSVGVMLWEALTGKKVWENLSDVEVIQTVLESGIPAPSTVASDIPEVLERICMKSVAEEPDNRYSTAAEMQEDLDAAISSLGYKTSVRDVAGWMETTFSERRARIRAIIRSQIEQEHAKPVELGSEVTFANLANMELSQLSTGSVPLPFEPTQLPARKRYGIIAIGSVILLVGGATVGQVFHRDKPHPTPTPVAAPESAAPVVAAPQPPPAAEAAPATADVEVHLAATPKNARMFLDDEQVQNPFWAKRPIDNGNHTLRVEARGYTPKTIELGAFRAPIDFTVSLELPSAPGRRTTPAASKPKADNAPAASPKGVDCDSPFYRDADGIMRVKPECVH